MEISLEEVDRMSFTTTLHRIRKEELEAAVQEKLEQGWELILPITPKTTYKSDWSVPEKGQFAIEQYRGTEVHQVYFCKMRKVEEPVNKTEARKRVGYLKQRQDELIEDLLTKHDQLNDDIKRLESDLKKALSQNDRAAAGREKNLATINRLSRQNDKLSRANARLTDEVADLKRKLENASSAAASGTRRASVQGFYPAVIKNGKRTMVLGTYNTPEEAEKHELRAYKAL
jgi:uncharacterized phage infection (PIP) family protein YhgE